MKRSFLKQYSSVGTLHATSPQATSPLRTYIMCILLVILAIPESYAQLTPSGTEAIVNSTTANRQGMSATAMDSTGNYVAVWESLDTDGSGYGIYAQAFDSSGNPIGVEIQVNTTTAHDQRHPDVGMDQNGNFTVVWMSDVQDGSGWGIYRRSFDLAGSPLSGELQVNDRTEGHQRDPAISMISAGEAVIVWRSISLNGRTFGIAARRIDNARMDIGPSFPVNRSLVNFAEHPTTAMRDDGAFMILWQATFQDASDIVGRAYDTFGGGITGDTRYNTTITGDQIYPDIDVLSDGKYALIWASNDQDGDGYGVFGQMIDSTGTTVGSEFQVNTVITGNQEFPSIAAASDEGFVVSWADYGRDGSFTGEYAQLFSTNGMKTGPEVQINSTTTLFQQFGDLSWSKSDRKVAATWQSGERNVTNSQDGSDYGIYQQRFTAKVALPNSIGPDFSYKALSISPNPTKTLTRIEWDMRAQGGILEVFDMQGKLVHSAQITSANYELDVSAFGPGAYFLRIIESSEKRVHAGRFVKVN